MSEGGGPRLGHSQEGDWLLLDLIKAICESDPGGGDRADKITRAMDGNMPDRIAKYRQDAKDRKPVKTMSSIFKRVERLEMKKARKR